jgi:hypothetical protein
MLPEPRQAIENRRPPFGVLAGGHLALGLVVDEYPTHYIGSATNIEALAIKLETVSHRCFLARAYGLAIYREATRLHPALNLAAGANAGARQQFLNALGASVAECILTGSRRFFGAICRHESILSL